MNTTTTRRTKDWPTDLDFDQDYQNAQIRLASAIAAIEIAAKVHAVDVADNDRNGLGQINYGNVAAIEKAADAAQAAMKILADAIAAA
jgi:hypothetical protein